MRLDSRHVSRGAHQIEDDGEREVEEYVDDGVAALCIFKVVPDSISKHRIKGPDQQILAPIRGGHVGVDEAEGIDGALHGGEELGGGGGGWC